MNVACIDFEFESAAAEVLGWRRGYVRATKNGALILEGPVWKSPWCPIVSFDSDGVEWELPPGLCALWLNGERVPVSQLRVLRNDLADGAW